MEPGAGEPGLVDPDLHSRHGSCVVPGDAGPLLRQRPDRGLLPHAEPATAATGPPPAPAPASAQLPAGQDPAPQQVQRLPGLHPGPHPLVYGPPLPGLMPSHVLLTPNLRLLFPGLPYMCVLAPKSPAQPCTPPSPYPWLSPDPCLCCGPGGWTRRGASCSRASRPGTRSGCASSTTVSLTWIPRWAGSGRGGGLGQWNMGA